MTQIETQNTPAEIVFITGAHGTLGRAILDRLAQDPDRLCVGLQRQAEDSGRGNVVFLPGDLSDFGATTKQVETVLAAHTGVKTVTLIHAVGPFRYEGYTKRGEIHEIDPKIMLMNDGAFEAVVDTILSHAGGDRARVNLCTFGSMSEPYNVPLWYSFNQAKKKVRNYIEAAVARGRSGTGPSVSGLYMRTSTIDTDHENAVRPLAPPEIKKYWLRARDVAADFCGHLETLGVGEFDLAEKIMPKPGFNPQSYYTDVEKLDRHWRAMMPAPR